MKTCDNCMYKGAVNNGPSCTRTGEGYCVNFSKWESELSEEEIEALLDRDIMGFAYTKPCRTCKSSLDKDNLCPGECGLKSTYGWEPLEEEPLEE